jgi:heme/copper-type cytochrome/quinol oxidase subunit 3
VDRLALADEAAMTVQSSRFARPVAPGAENARTIGWWAIVLGIFALAHFVGALIVAYLYLRAGHAEWPPAGVDPPPLLLPAIATGAVAVGAVLATVEARWTARQAALGMLGALGALVAGVVAVTIRMFALFGAEFRWNEHTYGSLYWLLGMLDVVLVGSAVIGSAALLAQHAMGDYDEQNYDEIIVLSVYWWFVVASSVALYITNHLVPYL